MTMFEIIKRYGKYLGGIDCDKVMNLITSEESKLKIVEERLLNYLEYRHDSNDTLSPSCSTFKRSLKFEIDRLRSKLEYLKNHERRILETIVELKRRGATLYEINKASRQLRLIRRRIRKIRKLLKYLEDLYLQS